MKITRYILKFAGVLNVLLALFFAAGAIVNFKEYYTLLLGSVIYTAIGVGLFRHKPWTRAVGIVISILNVLLGLGQQGFWYSLLINGMLLTLLVNPWASQLAPLRVRQSLAALPAQPWKDRYFLAGCLFIGISFAKAMLIFLLEELDKWIKNRTDLFTNWNGLVVHSPCWHKQSETLCLIESRRIPTTYISGTGPA